jgi:hypothetical protein
MGAQAMNITGRLIGQGKDLVAVIDKATVNRTRVRGY